MITWLVRHFVPNAQNTQDSSVRARYGMLSGGVGIALNLFLFLSKLLAGLLSHSIAITADAFNNLSDAASSVVTLLGFRLAERPADSEHPFGHGRIEYISGLVVSIFILLVGVELFKSAFDKILHPQATQLSLLTFAILLLSILVKLWMCHFNRTLAKKIDSTALHATAQDSLSDVVATSAVLLGMLFAHFLGWQIDGWMGLLVALFILYTGFTTAKDSLSPLLGRTPSPAFVAAIEKTVLAHPEVIGLHDLIVHDYGPGQCMVSLHAEVRSDEELLVIHGIIDRIELELRESFHCEATIHMDPVDVNDAATALLQQRTVQLIHAIDPKLSIHDFRSVPSPSHTNLIFDIVVPHRFQMSDEQVARAVREGVEAFDGGTYFAVTRVEHSYTQAD